MNNPAPGQSPETESTPHMHMKQTHNKKTENHKTTHAHHSPPPPHTPILGMTKSTAPRRAGGGLVTALEPGDVLQEFSEWSLAEPLGSAPELAQGGAVVHGHGDRFARFQPCDG